MAKVERKRTGKPKMNVGTYHKKMGELKKKIKQTKQDAATYEEGNLDCSSSSCCRLFEGFLECVWGYSNREVTIVTKNLWFLY